MKTILILLFPIVLIGCSNSLSDKEVDAMLDKAGKPPSEEIVCIGCDSIQYVALVKMLHQKPKSESAKFGEALQAYSEQLNILIKNQNILARRLDKINKELDEHLAGQNWKINPPDYSHDTGIVLPNLPYQVVSMPITTGGSSVTIGPSALRKGVPIKDSFATIGSNNTSVGDTLKIGY